MQKPRYIREILKILLLKRNRMEYMMRHASATNKCKIIRKFLRLCLARNHIIVSGDAIIEGPIALPHPQNIVIGGHATIGKGCTIYHDVTLGQKRGQYPTVGDNVIIYPGAKVIGGITVGNNAVIGANSVVVSNVPSSCVVAGIPAKNVAMNTGNFP